MHEPREDDGIDSAIDRAVLEIMDADAHSAFRARVLARIEQPRTLRWWPWLPLGAVAGAAIVLTVLTWPGHQRATPTTSAQPHVSIVPPAVPDLKVQTPAHPSKPVSAPQSRRGNNTRRLAARPEIAATQAGASRGAIPAVDVAPLTPVEDIQVAPIVREAIVSSAIAIAPLTPMAAVQIEPLSAQTARD